MEERLVFRLEGGQWIPVEDFFDLEEGDIFRMYDPDSEEIVYDEDGHFIWYITQEAEWDPSGGQLVYVKPVKEIDSS